jgi:hypothetical protein
MAALVVKPLLASKKEQALYRESPDAPTLFWRSCLLVAIIMAACFIGMVVLIAKMFDGYC